MDGSVAQRWFGAVGVERPSRRAILFVRFGQDTPPSSIPHPG